MTFKPENITGIIDSREQAAYSLDPMRSRVDGLPTADYSVDGLQDLVALERKSLPDFVACCGPERMRFEAELHRMMAYRYRAVVIEADLNDVSRHHYRSRIEPASVVGSIATWCGRYTIPIMFCGDRQGGQDFTVRFLTGAARTEWRRLEAFRKSLDVEVEG